MKVLVVEDDARIASAVKRGLDAEGFSVQVSFNGEDACGGPLSSTTTC
jgi:two-component system OmpR family response regulator